MPRTVESIVANHQAAAALRAAGRPIWKQTIDIKSILNEDQNNESPEHVTDVAHRIAKLLRAKVPVATLDERDDDCDFNLLEAVEDMENCSVAALAEDLKAGIEAVEMLNGWLETVYDWADANRVWMGN